MIGYLVGFGHAGVIAAAALPPFPCCGGELRSRGRQGGVGLEEQVFVRAGIGQGELDPGLLTRRFEALHLRVIGLI